MTKIYGGRKRNGVCPAHYSVGSKNVARKVLQALELLKMIEKDPNGWVFFEIIQVNNKKILCTQDSCVLLIWHVKLWPVDSEPAPVMVINVLKRTELWSSENIPIFLSFFFRLNKQMADQSCRAGVSFVLLLTE